VEEPESAPPEAGCPFQRRCPHALPGTCDSVTPPWRDAEGGHRIRCHLELDVLASTTADTKELEAS
jgi:peptide/nickel transport system ATP-binding protein